MEVPEYDFTRHRRSDVTRRVDPADVIIIEGILVLHMAGLRDLLSMKIYVDTGASARCALYFYLFHHFFGGLLFCVSRAPHAGCSPCRGLALFVLGVEERAPAASLEGGE